MSISKEQFKAAQEGDFLVDSSGRYTEVQENLGGEKSFLRVDLEDYGSEVIHLEGEQIMDEHFCSIPGLNDPGAQFVPRQ